MKKCILFFILLLTFVLNNNIKAEESVVFSDAGVEIGSDSFTTANDRLNFIKGSNIFIKLTNQNKVDYEDKEPKLDIQILNNQNNTIWTASNPKTKAPDPQKQSTEFENYLNINKNFFKSVSYNSNIIDIKIPLNIEGGDYTLKVSSSNYPEVKLDYKFSVSKSSYNFTDSNIIIEDSNVFANIGYESMLNVDQNNKVVITLFQDNKELFKKEIEKTFYKSGVISINEKVDAFAGLTGNAVLKIDILDKDGSVILTKIKEVDITKAGLNKIYYVIFSVLILLLIIIFMIFKKKKQKLIASMMVLMITTVAFVGIHTANAVTDVEACGTKPSNQDVTETVNGVTTCYVKKHSCQRFFKNSSCTIDGSDVRAKKYFSSGQVVDIPGSGNGTKTATASVNVCSIIPGSLPDGTNFYVIADSYGSDWAGKRFHVYRFTKTSNGSSKTTDSLGVGSGKWNENFAKYNGNCNVTVTSKYNGGQSNSEDAYVRIVEVGKMSSDVCKSIVVNRDFFDGNVDSLFDKANCTDKQLRSTFIAGSKTFPPVFNVDDGDHSAWHDKTVNICNYLGDSPSTRPNANFYVVMEQLGSWEYIRYPIFQFKFGTAENLIYRDIPNLTSEYAQKNLYRYGGDKENVPGVKYDGSCNITFRLDNRGDDTDSWDSTYELIEAGFTSEATCYDPELIRPTTYPADVDNKFTVYKLDGRGIAPYQIEYQSKIDSGGYDSNYIPPANNYTATGGSKDGGKYRTIAPFFKNLMDAGKKCKPIGSCDAGAVTGNWIPYFDGATCGDPTTTYSCVNRDYVTKVNGVETAREVNSPKCSLTASCSVNNQSSDQTLYTFTPSNAVGTVQYIVGGSVVATSPKTGSYTMSKPKVNSLETVTVDVKDTYDNTSVTKSCNNNYTPDDGCLPSDPQCTTSNPPLVELTKEPKVSLNKNGNCKITWDVQNIPLPGGSCNVTGWNVNGSGTTNYSIPLDATGNSNGSKTITGLTTNQKYTVSCSGGGMTPSPISASVICRVDPDVQER